MINAQCSTRALHAAQTSARRSSLLSEDDGANAPFSADRRRRAFAQYVVAERMFQCLAEQGHKGESLPHVASRRTTCDSSSRAQLESFAFARTALMRQRCEATQPANAGRRDAERRFGRMPCPR